MSQQANSRYAKNTNNNKRNNNRRNQQQQQQQQQPSNNLIRQLQQENKLLRQQKRLMVLSNKPFKEREWNHKRQPDLFTKVNEYHDNMLAEYVYGIFHPDAVYRENLNIKCPSVLPIPTTNFAFKETFTLKPNDKGNFVICWNPNYLGSSDAIAKLMNPQGTGFNGYFSNLYYDCSNGLDGNSAAVAFQAQTFKHIDQNFNKYRLASACIKVKYTGKVLNQSGMMAACASFMEFPRTMLILTQNQQMTSTYTVPNEFPQLQRLGDFDNIRQGQWAKTVNVVNDPDGITCVYIPTDPLSQTFVDNADTITSKQIQNYYPASTPNAIGTYWYSRNANITFDICGYGITTDSNVDPITVETYYNYEIIVNEDQLPFFRPTVQALTPSDAKGVADLMTKAATSVGTITQTKQHDAPTTMQRIRNAIGEGFKYAEKFLPLMKIVATLV